MLLCSVDGHLAIPGDYSEPPKFWACLPWASLKGTPESIRVQLQSFSISWEAGEMRNGPAGEKWACLSPVRSRAEVKLLSGHVRPKLGPSSAPSPQGRAVRVPGPHKSFLWWLPVQCHQDGLVGGPEVKALSGVRFLKCHVWDTIWHCLYIDLAPLLTTGQKLKALLLELECVNFWSDVWIRVKKGPKFWWADRKESKGKTKKERK